MDVERQPHARVGVGAVGVLIGARLADSWKSHIELSRKGYKPNPGKASVSLYITEAAVLVVVFAPGLIRNWQFAVPGIAVGTACFGFWFRLRCAFSLWYSRVTYYG